MHNYFLYQVIKMFGFVSVLTHLAIGKGLSHILTSGWRLAEIS